ncbi:TetR/AcrR family transcriptional regulator [Ferrovibrio sp. MS7]|jgi:AcrR family transcriptional regulator|uniref:TetR/AcrR family transcriptional regulator n=1 Tax=Ferrovibrio TaxID=1231242 RepID=UPI0031356D7A
MNTARKKRKIEKRRQEILSTAKQLFLNSSYLDVTMDEIAEAADMSKATIYSYFENKLEIYSAITLADAEALVVSLQTSVSERASTRENLGALAKAYITFFFNHPEYFEKLSWFYFPGREKHLSRAQIQAVGEKFEAARDVIAKCLNQGIKRGELRAMDVKTAAVTIYSQWLGLVYLAIAGGNTKRKVFLDIDKAIEFAGDMQIAGLMKRA